MGFDLAERRNAGLLVLGDLQDDKALLGADDVGNVARLHGESLVFEFLGQGAALEVAEVATLSGGGAVGVLLGEVFEAAALANLGQQIVRFGLGGRDVAALRIASAASFFSVETRISLNRICSGCSISLLCSS